MTTKKQKDTAPEVAMDGKLKNGLVRKNGRWHYRFMLKSSLVTGSTGCFDRRSAELYLLRLKSSLALDGVDVRAKKTATFGECYHLWMDVKGPRVSDCTIKMMMSHYRRVWSHWNRLPLTDLQPRIDALYQSYKLDHAVASQREMFAKLGMILKFARERCLHSIPFDIPLIFVPRAPKVVMTVEEVGEFFEQLDKIANLHQKVIIRALYHLGLRRSEAYGLRWDRYDEKNHLYTVEGKGGKIEQIPVPEEMREWIQKLPRLGRYMCPRRDQDTFHAEKYTDPVLKQAAAAMGFPEWSHHRLRASLASAMAHSGASLSTVAKALRHSSIQTTQQYYVEQDMNELRAAMERVMPVRVGPDPKVETMKVLVS
jgi:integrase